jgi:hypothetical protein
MLKVKSPQDFWSGALFIAFGAGGLLVGRGYALGSAIKMGPGYLPAIVCAGLIGLGLIIFARGLAVCGPRIEASKIGPQLAVLAAIVACGLLIERAGLIAAVAAVVAVATLASKAMRPLEAIALAVAMAALCWLLFVVLLGQPLRPWGA